MESRKSRRVTALSGFLTTVCLIFPGAPFIFSGPVQCAAIFNEYPYSNGDYRPSATYEEDRVIAGDGGTPETLSFRLSLYGSAAANLPLLVQVHEWGGNFSREEDIASYEPSEYSFVMLYFQYKPSTENEDDWWFGTHWEGVCRMWAHEAVMAVVREAIDTSLVPDHLPGVSVDRNRVYMFGHSIGGTGAWQLGVRNPDVFAAVHAHSGFARFTPPVGPFQAQFEADIVGGPSEGVTISADDGFSYPARDYSNLDWWLRNYREPGWQTPFMNITAGTADDTVPAASGGDLMRSVLDDQKRGFFYFRHSGGHSDACFVQLNWMWNFRLDQSFLSFTNRTGYGIGPDQTVLPWERGGVNDLYSLCWDTATIVDGEDRYEVVLSGSGTADVTPRRLQNFAMAPGAEYSWENRRESDDSLIASGIATIDADGLATVPAFTVSGGNRLIIQALGGGFPVRINFQPSDSTIPGGYRRDDGSGYSSHGSYSYGWR